MLYFNQENEKARKLLYNRIFAFRENVDKFVIITGYVGPQMVMELEKLKYKKIVLIVGMYGKNIDHNLHMSLLKINKQLNNLDIYYTDMLVHTKCYAWFNDDKITEILVGSANFSASGLLDSPYKEVLSNVDNLGEKSYRQYIDKIMDRTTKCENIHSTPNLKTKVAEEKETYKAIADNLSCNLSLLASSNGRGENIIGLSNKTGEVHAASGLNWGYSSGSPKLGDAYIAITSKVIDETSIIPSKVEGENTPVEVIWDDGQVMKLLFEANGSTRNGNLYPKQISSYNNKQELGNYLRKRIGDRIGKDLLFTDEAITKIKKLKDLYKGKDNKNLLVKQLNSDISLYRELNEKIITKNYLEKYGRTDITVRLISEGVYYFDFSVK